MRQLVYLAIGLCLIAPGIALAAPKELKTATDKLSYSAGYHLGDNFKKQKLDMRLDLVMQGLEDALYVRKPPLTKGEMRKALRNPKQFLADENASFKEQTREQGRLFLEENAKKNGVIVLPSGLQYKILRAGNGKRPQAEAKVKLNYQGTDLQGRVFDSTYAGDPAELNLSEVIEGMAEALQLMQEGAKWELYITADLAYKNRGSLADETLIYLVELLEVVPESN